MREYEVIVIGAGPAGLSAAYESAAAGAQVVVLDENKVAGGQLVRQIHKFFGSAANSAGKRGFDIAANLRQLAVEKGANILTDTPVYGIYPDKTVVCGPEKKSVKYMKARQIIIATGANEDGICFEGGDLPGVMTAGAAQYLINVQRVLPGKRAVVVGSGNVGLIVAYQLLQTGMDVACIVEQSSKIKGYGVYAARIARADVPIYLDHTVRRCSGFESVETVEIESSEGQVTAMDADTLCIAAGLSPMTELAYTAGCREMYIPELGGNVTIHDENMKTSQEGIYVAGDAAGIEEAGIAMEEGRLAGINCAEALGYVDAMEAEKIRQEINRNLRGLRSGAYYADKCRAKERQISGVTEVNHE